MHSNRISVEIPDVDYWKKQIKCQIRAGASDEAIAHLIIEAVKNKEPGHKINAADFVKPARNMSTIGG